VAPLALQDEDTRLALNAISTKSEGDLNALSYYVMPFPWMKMAWDMMMMNDQGEDCVSSSRGSKNWREALGQVKLGPLLTLDKTHPPQLNSQFTYKRDYVLIGPNLWLLLKEKFGSDGEVKFPVVVDSGGESGLVVPTSASDFVPLPATGRFPYEIFFDNKRLQVAHVAVAAAAAAKGARRLHASPSPRTSSSGPGPGNVSDDEEDETKSLVSYLTFFCLFLEYHFIIRLSFYLRACSIVIRPERETSYPLYPAIDNVRLQCCFYRRHQHA
jgi:hypothetical protein